MANVVVWEWLTENDNWKLYVPLVCSAIEKSFRKGQVLKLGDIEPSLSAYQVDPSILQQKRIDTSAVRSVRRTVFPAGSAPAKGICWQWFEESKEAWLPYSPESMCIIEDEYCKKNYKIDLSQTTCALPYIVDTINMVQVRLKTGYRREIRRTQLSSSYPFEDETDAKAEGPLEPSASAFSDDCRTKVADCGNVENGELVAANIVTRGQASHDAQNPSGVQFPQQNRKPSWKSKQIVAAVEKVHTTLAWGDADESSATATVDVAVEASQKQVSRSISEPGTGVPFVKAHGLDNTITRSIGPSTSATRPKVLTAGSSKRGMSRSQSMPVTITARPAHAAGPHLSPIMTSITGMLMSPIIPCIRLNSTPVPVFNPPHTSKGGIRQVLGVKPSKKRRKNSFVKVYSAEDVMKQYVVKVNEPPEENCPICVGSLQENSDFQEEDDDEVLELKRCNHIFHRSCLHAMYLAGPKDGSLQCPTCKAIYGVKHGNQPPGRMEYHVIPHSLQGFQECGTIRIIYDIPPGTQGTEHPHPGKRYTANFPRHCYLPDNDIGRKILKLLIVAWDRRLIFTIGTSVTTGQCNTVVWNEIHHKTEFGSNVTGHGYPDPNYFQNILGELAAQGVTEESAETN